MLLEEKVVHFCSAIWCTFTLPLTLNTLLAAILLGFYLYILNRGLQKNYRGRFATLKDANFKMSNEATALKEELGAYQLDIQALQMTCQANKKIHTLRDERQKERLNRIDLSLGDLQKSFKNPLGQLREAQQMEALLTCRNESTALLQGLWQPIMKVEIDFKAIMDNILHLFADKIHKAAIRVEINIESPVTPFLGDPLWIEALLINVVGKALLRVPKNGTVSIILKEGFDFLFLEVQDNGFAGVEAAEKLIRKPFELLFMTEEAFQQACLSNGLHYTCLKTKNGSNITHLSMPTLQEENLNSNVVQLFP